jgi:glycosyltransferase involved in cell wall biosynthesis
MRIAIRPSYVNLSSDGRSDVIFECSLPSTGREPSCLPRARAYAICGGMRKRRARTTVLDDIAEDEGMRHLVISVHLTDFVNACTLFLFVGSIRGGHWGTCSVTPEECARLIHRSAQEDPSYDRWFRLHRSDEQELSRQRAEVRSLGQEVLFSVVVPVFRTPAAYLRAMVDSILAQTYGRFELVLVNASGECKEVDDVLASYDDPRLRVLAAENKGIATNTNVGIKASVGDYLVFVDHDDLLEPDALYRFAAQIRTRPKADLLFSADDLWGSPDGGSERFFGGRFKPGWNPDLLLSYNYVFHLMTVSRYAVSRIELPGPAMDGAQDYDLAWKVSELARDICYVPHVLYHWRLHAGSTSKSQDSKPYALEAGARAIEAHLQRQGVRAQIHAGRTPFSYKVDYLEWAPSVSVIVPVWDLVDFDRCLESLLQHAKGACHEILVVGPSDLLRARGKSISMAKEKDPRVSAITLEAGKRSRAAIVNSAARRAAGDIVVVLEPDCYIEDDAWLGALIGPLARPEVGCAAPLLLARDGKVAAHGLFLREDGTVVPIEQGLDPENPGYMTFLAHPLDVAVAPGACQALRRKEFLSLGGYREGFGTLASIELCLRLDDAQRLVVSVSYSPVERLGRVRVPEQWASRECRQALIAAHPSIAGGAYWPDPNLNDRNGFFELCR